MTLLAGCQSAQLAPGGAYAPTATNIVNGVTNVVATAAPDIGLYTADAAFALAYDSYDMVVNLERKNRALFWQISPAIKHTLDATKDEAWLAASSYTTARASYMANPTAAGLSGLQTALGRMQQVANAAQAAAATVAQANNKQKGK